MQSRNVQPFKKTECSSPSSQQHATDILSWIKSVLILTPYLFKFLFNSILPSIVSSSKTFRPFRLSDQYILAYNFLISPMRATYTSSLILLNLITLIISAECKLWSSHTILYSLLSLVLSWDSAVI